MSAKDLISGAGEKVPADGGEAGDWPNNWALLRPVSAGALDCSEPVDDEANGSKGFVSGSNGDEGWAAAGAAWTPKG